MASAFGNMENPSDAESTSFASMSDQVDFDGLPKNFIKYFKEAKKLVDQMVEEWSKAIKDTEAATGKMGGDKPGAGRLGLGSFTRAEKVGMGIGLAAFGASTYMSAAPNTMAAVTQRMGADTYAGLSGMSSRRAILQANKQVGGGATSAMGPTMAAMNLMYQGGYTASSISSKNIMGQIGGLSAMSGMSNEMAAASVAGMNGMSFLRAGIQIRDRQGNLKPPNQIINDVYSFLYRGQKITKQQAALVLNPGSKGYATIQQITGGDPQLMQMIQSGILARASNGTPLTSSQMKDPNKILNAMGVDQSSPIRANFRFNSSENKKLASTEQGLVGGYDVSLRTTAALNDAYSKMADVLGPVNDGLMTLKGVLQTLPNAGNMGGLLAGFGSAIGGAISALVQFAVVTRLLGGAGGAAGILSKGAGLAGAAATVGAGALASLGAGAVGYGVGKGGKALGKKLNTSRTTTRLGSAAAGAGAGAATGAALGLVGGPLAPLTSSVGAVIGTIVGGLGGFFGSGGPSDHGNLGVGGPASNGSLSFGSPVPKGTVITSPFGPRDNSAHPGISANHHGIDFGTPVGSNLTAVTDGTISYLGNDATGYGTYLDVKHDDGTSSRYGHLSQVNVSKGQKVKPGQTVGKSGGKKGAAGAGNSTGPHLHFEIMNEKGVKVNPAPYLSGAPSGPIGTSVSAPISGPTATFSNSMSSAKKAVSKGNVKGKNVSQLSSPVLSSSLSNLSFNEDVGGPNPGMNIGVAGSSSHSRNVVINLKMDVHITQGSVQEADRLVRMIGKKLKDSDILKQIGSAL
jgi:murein DD-endopeptidase MepM/ murein hydrolase activator NlpD